MYVHYFVNSYLAVVPNTWFCNYCKRQSNNLIYKRIPRVYRKKNLKGLLLCVTHFKVTPAYLDGGEGMYIAAGPYLTPLRKRRRFLDNVRYLLGVPRGTK
jgi:hypothetical protein